MYHRSSNWINVRLLGGNIKLKGSKPLNEIEAVNQGAELLAEAMVWSAAAFQIIFLQYYSSISQKEAKQLKEEQLESRFNQIEIKYNQLINENSLLKIKIDTLLQIINNKSDEIDDDNINDYNKQ